MSLTIARAILAVAAVYVAVGAVFAAAFLTVGIGRVDPAGRSTSVGLRLLLAPATVALWPLLLKRWASGASAPPDERNAHRDSAEAHQ